MLLPVYERVARHPYAIGSATCYAAPAAGDGSSALTNSIIVRYITRAHERYELRSRTQCELALASMSGLSRSRREQCHTPLALPA